MRRRDDDWPFDPEPDPDAVPPALPAVGATAACHFPRPSLLSAWRRRRAGAAYPQTWMAIVSPRNRIVLLVAVLSVAAALAAAVSPPARVAIGEVEAGQTGFGLTVFAGTEPDTFGVTVLGVQRGARPAGDIILVELAGHDLERTAVAQGMSGSPIYLDDGRLLGAVAFGWPGALRPIAGLTPASELDLARDRRDEVAASAGAAPAALLDPASLLAGPAAGRLAARLLPGVEAPIAPRATRAGEPPWPTVEELAAMLLPRASVVAAGSFAPLELGLYVLPAGAGNPARATTAATAPRLVPGSACAVTLVAGDAQLGAIGTVSLVEGDRVVCMAHPFLQLGPVDLPLAAADVVTLFPSRDISFKMGSAGPAIGRVTHDLRAGLVGVLGEAAATVPVEVAVTLPSGQRTLDFAVAVQPELTPALVFWCLYNALLVDGDDRSEQMVTYEIGVDLAERGGATLPTITLAGATGGAGGVAALAADWQAPLQILLGNRHRPLGLTRVRAELRASRPVPSAMIRALYAPAVITPGEPFTVEVEVEPRYGQVRRERFTMRAPAGLAPGTIRLGAASAREFFALDAMRASGLFEDHSLEATFDLLNRPRSLDVLTVALISPEPGFTAGGRELGNLPDSVRRTLAAGPTGVTRPTLAGYLLRDSRPVGMLLQGDAVVDVEVRRPPAPRAERERP